MLWKFNQFMPEKPCQTGAFAKRLLLMLIDVGLPAICVILPPAACFTEVAPRSLEVKGKIKEDAGRATNDPSLEVSGRAERKAGKSLKMDRPF